MYNEFKHFKGDIVITDPCYIVKNDNNERFKTMPCWWDFISKQRTVIKDGVETHEFPKAEEYPDAVPVPVMEYIKNGGIDFINSDEFDKFLENPSGHCIMVSKTLNAEKAAHDEAMEKWQAENESDWEKCDCGDEMEALGFKNYLAESTVYGDWSCHVKNVDTNEIIGQFCADAAMVGVFLLDEILVYNPDFEIKEGCHWATLIKDFNGRIEIARDAKDNVCVKGQGNINFKSYQTGL